MTTTLDPVAAAEQWLAPVRLDETAVLFVIGFGEGHVLDVLDRRGWAGHVIALEPEASMAAECLNRQSVRDWQVAGRLTVLAGPDYAGLDKTIAALPLNTEKPVIAGNPEVARAHREACVHAARTVSRAWFGARANDEARKQNAGRYLLNTLRNLPRIAREADAASLVGAFSGTAALVVAAGPSLDRNMPDIVAFRDRVLLIAVDTALRPLLAAGVQPDLVVAVDPSEANACHLVDLPACPHTHFVSEGSIDPEALAHFEDRTFVFRVAGHHPWPWLRSRGLDRQPLRAWGSVLTTAFDLALQMGCEPIVFAGADLAYTDGRPYARGTTYEESWRREQAWGSSLDETWAARLADWPETFEQGVAGTAVRTAPHLRSFRDWIVTEAGKSSGRTIINATEGGMLVGDGVRQSTLTGALASLPPLTFTPWQSIAACHRVARNQAGPVTSQIGEDVVREWTTFAGVSVAAIRDAFERRPAAVRIYETVSVEHGEVATPVATPASVHPGLSENDAAYLAGLAQTETLRIVVVTDPAQDLLAELRRQSSDLAPSEALVIVDEVGIGVGAQVRRAVDALLCERADLWLEYRRFADHASRLTVLRSGAAARTPPAEAADAAKWDAAHEGVADSLVPIIVSQLAPASAVDLGCGAGFWLKALMAHGVSDVRGVSPRPEGSAVVPGVDRASLMAIPDWGRRFDVCLCLEVAQRIAPDAQGRLVEACTRLSDVVVFSSTPPGVAGSSPHDRPLPYWAELFWRHGYVLDDSLRAGIQARWDSPRTVFDCLVVFRRQAAPAAVDTATRIHDLYMQSIWWSVLAADRLVPAIAAPVAPQSPSLDWPIPSSRLMAAAAPTRLFRFRTDAARWYLTHPLCALDVREDGRSLPCLPDAAALSSSRSGGWTRWRDEVNLAASDGSDPRTNGRRYTICLPAHVGWAESQALHDALTHSL